MEQYNKILALDLGDRWVGVAISDPLGFFARPLTTVEAHKLNDFLTPAIVQENITTIVVGHPKTLRGTNSQQTDKVVTHVEALKQLFPLVAWQLWDERLTSKQASTIKQEKTKEDRVKSHALAAAIILQSYLEYLRLIKKSEEII